MIRTRPLIAALAAAFVAAFASQAQAAPISLLYDLDPAVRAIVVPADGQRGLGPERGALRQEPSGGHLFGGASDAPYRVAKVSMRDLERMSAPAMAATLRRAIDRGCGAFGCASHLVGVDELGASVADGKPFSAAHLRTLKGRKAIRAAASRGKPVKPSSPAARFSKAMKLLDVPSPYGGTYASRVHVFIAPAMSTAIAKGRGPNHNLGRDGKPHFTTWLGVMPGIARAGGVWLEMYHGRAGSVVTEAMTATEWRTVARDFADLHGRSGGDIGRLHFLFTHAKRPPGAPASCGLSAMACSWALASSGSVNARVLANGPGVYRVGDAASEWLAEYNRRFP